MNILVVPLILLSEDKYNDFFVIMLNREPTKHCIISDIILLGQYYLLFMIFYYEKKNLTSKLKAM